MSSGDTLAATAAFSRATIQQRALASAGYVGPSADPIQNYHMLGVGRWRQGRRVLFTPEYSPLLF